MTSQCTRCGMYFDRDCNCEPFEVVVLECGVANEYIDGKRTKAQHLAWLIVWEHDPEDAATKVVDSLSDENNPPNVSHVLVKTGGDVELYVVRSEFVVQYHANKYATVSKQACKIADKFGFQVEDYRRPKSIKGKTTTRKKGVK